MEINERIYVTELLETYGSLLTSTQKQIMEDYYLFDLSFSEIAQQRNISRSAVSDTLSKVISKLENYEANLSILKNRKVNEEIINNIIKDRPELKAELSKIKK